MFSSTMMASSITMPTIRVKASMVIWLRVNPMAAIRAKVEMIEVGMAMEAIRVVRILARKRKMTSAETDPTDGWMAELEAGNSGTEAGRVFSEVRQGLAGGEAWACGLVPLGLKKPRLRPAASAPVSATHHGPL